MKALGQNLIRIRVEQGLSKNDLSVLLGISASELEAIENGSADVDTEFVYKIADILQVGLDDLFCSDKTRNQLLNQIKNTLDTCSEKELVLVFEYITGILKK
jgi:transcriptional regulator with XRE-family HTH domain